jgi:iron uptake system component EfeO
MNVNQCSRFSRFPAVRVPRAVSRWAALLSIAALGAALVGTKPGRAATLDDGAEQYRSHLITDVDRTLTSARTLATSAAAGDVAGAKRAWIEARVGWERSEVFTTGFVPELDRDIDAWPNGVIGFHAIEAKLFGANRTDFEKEANGLVRNGIELAWRTIFAPTAESRDRQVDTGLRHSIEELKAMVDVGELRRVDPDRLRAATEELVLKLQNAAPLLDLKKPTLEADAR